VSAKEEPETHHGRLSVLARHKLKCRVSLIRTGQSLGKSCRRAVSRQERLVGLSHTDHFLSDWLKERGLPATLLQAVGPYNVDVATGSVAVECYGGAWHNSGRAAARWPQRVRYLLDAGWHVLVIWIEPSYYPLTVEAVDYVVALAQLAGSDPSAVRQYRVIRGTGKVVAFGP